MRGVSPAANRDSTVHVVFANDEVVRVNRDIAKWAEALWYYLAVC